MELDRVAHCLACQAPKPHKRYMNTAPSRSPGLTCKTLIFSDLLLAPFRGLTNRL
jgi:hypothetical protein